MKTRWMLALALSVAACDSPGGGAGTASDGAITTDAVGGDATSATAMDSSAADSAAVDSAATDSAAADSVAVGDALAETDSPSIDHPSIACRVDGDCAGGEVCCTNASVYSSECIAADDCSGGAHDACVTDAQCQARRPGEWTTCCHDRGARNYCAPSTETCQPLVPCSTPSDCAGNGSEVCCSPHHYYGASFCTSEFFANPAVDCPAH
ncbi:MAG: hypothetical protein U1F43_22735 [Myxococcota bacterium]